MSTSTAAIEFFDLLAKILLRCTIFGVLLLVFWFGAILLFGDLVYEIHGNLFGLSDHELSTIHYCGMALVKLLVGLFFFFPWMAIRLVLKGQKAGSKVVG